jgi:hypothetical protein
VRSREANAFAASLSTLLGNPSTYSSFASAARDSARRFETAETIRLWDRVLPMDAAEATESA